MPSGAAQTSHPASLLEKSDDHMKVVFSDSGSPKGPSVPSYVAPFIISWSQVGSVLKAVALRSWPTELLGVIVHDWP